MPVCVHSEIGPLQKVLLHRPGAELEYLVPNELARLLIKAAVEGAGYEYVG